MQLEDIISQRECVEKEARTWLNTPFHHEGRVKKAGVDCAQFLAGVMENVFSIKVRFPEFPGYARGHYPAQWHLHDLDNEAKANFYLHAFEENPNFIEIDKSKIGKGDILLSVIGRTFCHGGIVINWPEVIQSESATLGKGCVCLANASCNWFLTRREIKFFSWREWHV